MKKALKLLLSISLCLVALFSFAYAPTKSVSVSAADDDIWVDSLPEPENYAYSLAVVGDTQYVTMYDQKALYKLYQWIAENAEAKKTAYVIGVGDMTHTDGAVEWANVYEAVSILEGHVPYALVRGNHDNRTIYYDYHFGREDSLYANHYIEAYMPDSRTRARNTAHEFTVGNLDYLIICLDFGATDDVLEWANEVVASYPRHNVIVTTHAYIDEAGKRLTTSSSSPSSYDPKLNSGEDLWNKFIKKHENISMVFCGHVFNLNIVQSTAVGENGNVVTTHMVNPQYYEYNKNNAYDPERLTGMVAMYYFSADGKTVDVQWYSTIKNKYYNPNVNAFTFSPSVTTRGEKHFSARAVGHGSVTPTYLAQSGSNAPRFNFTPDKYYDIARVTLDGKDVTSMLKVNSQGVKYLQFAPTDHNHHIVVTYKDQRRYLLLEQNDLSKGAIVYSHLGADATYGAGEELTFKVNATTGYEVASVTFNGESLTPDNSGNYYITIQPQDNILAVNYNSTTSANTQNNAVTGANTGETTNTVVNPSANGCSSSIFGGGVFGLFTLVIGYLVLKRK